MTAHPYAEGTLLRLTRATTGPGDRPHRAGEEFTVEDFVSEAESEDPCGAFYWGSNNGGCNNICAPADAVELVKTAEQMRARRVPTCGLERARQDSKWGEQNHPDGTGLYQYEAAAERARREYQRRAHLGTVTWTDILREEVYEAFAEADPARLREELLQVAAVAVAWAEAIDRRASTSEDPDA